MAAGSACVETCCDSRDRPSSRPLAAGRLLGARLQLDLRVGDRLDVGRRSSGARTPLDVPRRADDLLLRRDQAFELGARGRGHRLALRHRVLLVERLHLEKEDLASRQRRRLPAGNVARPRVVADDVARLDAQILRREQARTDTRHVRAADGRERHDLFLPARNRVNEIEARDPVIVVGACFDRDFLERRDALIADRTKEVDLRRPVVHQPDEVLHALRRETVRIGEGDAISAVLGHA